jgi:hypothetical protein
VSKKRKTCHAVVLTDKRVIDVHICSGAAKRTDALMGGWQQVQRRLLHVLARLFRVGFQSLSFVEADG